MLGGQSVWVGTGIRAGRGGYELLEEGSKDGGREGGWEGGVQIPLFVYPFVYKQ